MPEQEDPVPRRLLLTERWVRDYNLNELVELARTFYTIYGPPFILPSWPAPPEYRGDESHPRDFYQG